MTFRSAGHVHDVRDVSCITEDVPGLLWAPWGTGGVMEMIYINQARLTLSVKKAEDTYKSAII